MFSFLRKKNFFFTPTEQQEIKAAIVQAEHRTSGEIRVFVESHCSYMDAIDRAIEIFLKLQMQNTTDRNSVLVYLAIKDRQLAVFGDEGIHKKVGNEYWNTKVKEMIAHFNKEDYADGICHCVLDIGEALQSNFTYNENTDKNELPDDIVFGK